MVPSNVKEGYLSRMLFRRSYRLLRHAGIEDRLPDMVDAQIGLWGDDFPQLKHMRDEILEMVSVEKRTGRSCQDVFITASGASGEEVVGWLTDKRIERYALLGD